MTRELFVSSTPHETRVGMVEDDQLAEIYLERENEYTLAGSIYKGRVTRVLPGMQSAFVDIGLERDAFLYVSDFMELHEEDEVEEIPAKASQPQTFQPQQEPQPTAETAAPSGAEHTATNEPGETLPQPENREKFNGADEREARNDWRSRRRRGRGRRGERMPESRFSRPEPHGNRTEYTPPPGYQPIVLPGESISKYQKLAQPQTSQHLEHPVGSEAAAPIAGAFPEDEPLFTQNLAGGDHQPPADEQPRAEPQSEEETEQENMATPEEKPRSAASSASGTLEEEEIEEEEADLASYVEELDEDSVFDEMEEETQHAADYQPPMQEIAASAEPSGSAAIPFSSDPVAPQGSDIAEAEEEVDEAEEEAALEEAQAEAEALLDAEARGNGTVEARAEVRAPSGTASYTQRAQRPAFDRRGGPRGRRGGRRFRRHEPQQLPQITDLLKEGQEILVQIAKEPIAKKGARITSHIALPGRFLVFMPTVHHTGVSRKIASEEERQRLKRIILSERENGHGGFIVRTAAQGASEEELRADIRFLKGLWSEIKTRAEMSKAPALIYHDLNVVERVLRDQVTSDFSQIWVDNEQEYERILRFANRFQPALVKRVKLYTKETPLFEQFGLTDEINKALKSKVWLKSGGYIVINQAEALVAIDVNTGKYVGKTARLEDTIVKTNVDAIKEIVRQIRLRDLGGIIIIDFIDMDERRNRQKVMQALEEALRSDRSPSKVLQFNDFGLVAITRKRVKQSLERTIGSPCPYCQSTGFVKSVTTVCNEVYLEMRKMAKHLEHSDVMLRVNPEVAKALKANNGRLLAEMEEMTKKSVIVKSDPSLHQEQFDIN
ncbi:MAG TPA: Rne/Rng family ribonuclease [Terriglobales bacterium]|nr:Rne/Rng family ribonuclease [Terriglobales bacterium]